MLDVSRLVGDRVIACCSVVLDPRGRHLNLFGGVSSTSLSNRLGTHIVESVGEWIAAGERPIREGHQPSRRRVVHDHWDERRHSAVCSRLAHVFVTVDGPRG